MEVEDVEAAATKTTPVAPQKAAPRQDLLVGSVQLVVEPTLVEVKDVPREVDIVETSLGPIHVTVYGPRTKPAVVTFHEFGVNHKICFSTFLNYPAISKLLEKYTIYQFDAPGHEEEAKPLDPSYQYPSVDGLSQMVHESLEKLSIKRPILLGVGTGATVLANYAAEHPGNVYAMILISGTAQLSTWTEYFWNWGEHYWLRTIGNGQTFQNAMIRGYLSTNGFYYNTDLLQSLTTEMSKIPYDAVNKLIQAYGKRTDISAKLHKLEIPTIIFAGAEAYNLDETVNMFSSFKPGTATWIKVDDSGTLLHLESPAALVQPLELWFKVI